MKPVSVAVNYLYQLLTQAGYEVFKGKKPAQVLLSRYVIVNSLPVTGDVLQTLRVNVNYYVKDLAESTPDMKTLEEEALLLTPLLSQVDDSALGIYATLESQNIEEAPAVGFHFANFRLLVRILNKN